MKSAAVAAIVLVVIVAPAAAEQRYDKRLESAAISIVAGKMGDLRRGFETGQVPAFVAPIDPSRPTHLSAKAPTAGEEAAPVDAAPPTSFVSF